MDIEAFAYPFKCFKDYNGGDGIGYVEEVRITSFIAGYGYGYARSYGFWRS